MKDLLKRLNKTQKILLVIILLLVSVFMYGIISYKKFNKLTFFSVQKNCIPDIIKPYLTQEEINSIEGEYSLQEKLFGRKCGYYTE